MTEELSSMVTFGEKTYSLDRHGFLSQRNVSPDGGRSRELS